MKYHSSDGYSSTISPGENWEFKTDSVILSSTSSGVYGFYLLTRVSDDSVYLTKPDRPIFHQNFKYTISNDTLRTIGLRTNISGDVSWDTMIFKH